MDRDGEEARRPFRPRRDDDGQPFRKDGFRPRRFNDRDGNEGQDAWKRPRPFARFDDEQDEAPRRDFRRPDRDGFRKPGFRQDADKPFRPRHDDEGRPFRKDGFRPRRFNDRDGNEGQNGQKRRAPFPRFDDEREGAPRRDFRRPERDGFGKPGFRQDADKPFRKNSFRRDGKPAFGSSRRDRGFDGPALNDDEE